MTMTQCIHELDEGTCSICGDPGPEVRDASLRGMIREAFELLGDQDEETVLRLVLVDILHRSDAADLLLPLLRNVKIGIDGERRRRIFDVASRPVESSSLPGARGPAQSKAVPPLVATSPTREPSEVFSLVPLGVTPAEFSRQHRADLLAESDDWVQSARRFAAAPVRISGWRGRAGQATLEQIDDKLRRLRHQATGVGNGIKDWTSLREVLVASGMPTLDVYLESRQA